jgi:hypothetical protein
MLRPAVGAARRAPARTRSVDARLRTTGLPRRYFAASPLSRPPALRSNPQRQAWGAAMAETDRRFPSQPDSAAERPVTLPRPCPQPLRGPPLPRPATGPGPMGPGDRQGLAGRQARRHVLARSCSRPAAASESRELRTMGTLDWCRLRTDPAGLVRSVGWQQGEDTQPIRPVERRPRSGSGWNPCSHALKAGGTARTHATQLWSAADWRVTRMVAGTPDWQA